MKGGKPYVAEDGLPNPLLSTLNAIKYLSSRDADDKDAGWNAQALSQLQRPAQALSGDGGLVSMTRGLRWWLTP